MSFYKNRIWIPYQVALEYHNNRAKILFDLDDAYSQLEASLTSNTKKFIDLLHLDNFKRHPFINVEQINNAINKAIDDIIKKLKRTNKDNRSSIKEDSILNKITELFNGRVGDDFTPEDLEKLYSEGKTRYQTKTPPGFCDEKEKKDLGKRQLYGDLIVWKQIIRHSNNTKKNIIFVTDDLKEDWWQKINGKKVGPRKELIREFHEETGNKVLIYNSDNFLEYANKRISNPIDTKTIKEVKSTRDEDELKVRFMSSYFEDKKNSGLPWGTISSLRESVPNLHDCFNEKTLSLTNINEYDNILSSRKYLLSQNEDLMKSNLWGLSGKVDSIEGLSTKMHDLWSDNNIGKIYPTILGNNHELAYPYLGYEKAPSDFTKFPQTSAIDHRILSNAGLSTLMDSEIDITTKDTSGIDKNKK